MTKDTKDFIKELSWVGGAVAIIISLLFLLTLSLDLLLRLILSWLD